MELNPFTPTHSRDEQSTLRLRSRFVFWGGLLGILFSCFITISFLLKATEIGATPEPVWLNVLLPALACFIWWSVFAGTTGYLVGHVFDRLFTRMNNNRTAKSPSVE